MLFRFYAIDSSTGGGVKMGHIPFLPQVCLVFTPNREVKKNRTSLKAIFLISTHY